ncbi:MAG: ABC transporter substrate-binding protein [Chloroflexota bacterium]
MALALVACATVPPPSTTPTFVVPHLPTAAPASAFNDWGWPVPYTQVSPRSIDWLQGQHWWPLGIGYQLLWSGQDAINTVMRDHRLLEQRGLDVTYVPFLSGVSLDQGLAANRIQVGSVGDVSFAALIERSAPIVAIAVLSPNQRNGTIVPLNSPLQRFADFRRSGLSIGVLVGSSSAGYLTAAARVNGLAVNRDFFFQPMDNAQQSTLPATVAGVAPREPVVDLILASRRTGRMIDVVYPYHFVCGFVIVRRELIENAPDVVQALADSVQEAILLVRYNPSGAVSTLSRDPITQTFPSSLLLQQTNASTTLYKPTFAYPFVNFWAASGAYLTGVLAASGQVTRAIDLRAWQGLLVPQFLQATYARLGWRVPERPPWIPGDWAGRVGRPPYPPYATVETLKSPQPWPEPGDLIRPWQFAGTTYYP